MLTISRRKGEIIRIGDPSNPIAVVRVASIGGSKVHLAILAAADVPVHREEVAQRIILGDDAEPGVAGGEFVGEEEDIPQTREEARREYEEAVEQERRLLEERREFQRRFTKARRECVTRYRRLLRFLQACEEKDREEVEAAHHQG